MNHILQRQTYNHSNQERASGALAYWPSTLATQHASPMELYLAIFEQAADGILVIDHQGRCQDLNRQACQMLGSPREELLKLSLQDLLRNVTPPQDLCHRFPLPADGPTTMELSLRGKDGRVLVYELRTQPFADGYLLAFLRDITERRRAELAFYEMAENMAAAQRIAHFGSWEVKLTADFKPLGSFLLSDECYRIFGFEPGVATVTFEAYMNCVHPDDRTPLVEVLSKNMQSGYGDTYEYRIMRADGAIRYIQQQSIWIRDEHTGRPLKIIGTAHDITEHKQAKAALSATEEQLRALVAISAQIVWTTDAKGLMVEDSPSWRAFTGQSYEECVGRGWLAALHPDDRPLVATKWQTAVATGAEYTSEHRMRHTSGEWRWTLSRAVPLRHSDGTIRSWVGMNTDVTERRRAEQAWRELAENMAAAQRIAHFGSWEVNLTADLEFEAPYIWSDECYRIFGFEPASFAVTNDRYFRSIHPDDYNRFMEIAHRDLHEGRNGSYEYRIIRPDGSIRYIHEQSLIVLDEQTQRPRKLVGMSHDITERKRAQEQLHYQANLLQNVSDAIIATDLNFLITNWNQGAETLYWWRAEEVMGKTLHTIVPTAYLDDNAESVWQDFWQQGPWKGEVVQYHRNGTLCNVMSSISFIKDSAGNTIGIVGVNRDISQRKRTEEALRQSEERLKLALATTQMGVWEWEVAANTVFWSPECCAIFGVPHFGGTLRDFTNFVAPSDVHEVITTFERALTNQSVYSAEFRIIRPDGEVRWVYNLGRATYDKSGEPVRVIGIVQDITERKRVEEAKAKLEEQLRQAQKMETIGRLAGGIAHDFNNLLTVIQGYCDLMLVKMASDNPLRGKLEQIQKAGKRASALTGQLLAFSRKQMLTPTVLDLNNLITNLQTMLERLIGEDITLTTVLHPHLWSVTADPSQIEQVIMNLVVNARDAMPTGGMLTIETTNLHRDYFHFPDKVEQEHADMLTGPCVMLAVTDTGCGMSEETQAHMFEPFFTTKEPGKGTGLGLATVYGIVKQSGGDIFVYSEPGHGSTFKIYLPANAELIKQPLTNCSHALPDQGHETILLVEDEELVYKLVRAALEDKGYTILEARYAHEALAVATQYPGTIDLLVTDVVMPQMSGRELAERMVLLRPEMKVLFTSGYTDDSVVRHGLLTAEVEFLPKPFSPRALTLKVREVLDK